MNYSAFSTFLHWQNYWQNYWGGGKTICLPPNIFIGGGGGDSPPPPPQDRRLCRYNVSLCSWFVTLVRILWSCTLVHDDLYRPETFQKLEKNPLMVVSEQSERAEIFALLRQKHIYIYYVFFIPTRKPETHEKAILIASEPKFVVFWGLKHTILLNILLINHMVNFVGTLNYVLDHTIEMLHSTFYSVDPTFKVLSLLGPFRCWFVTLVTLVTLTRDMVLFMMIYSDQKTRNSRKTHKWMRASGASEPKFWHFCVGNMWFFSISQ